VAKLKLKKTDKTSYTIVPLELLTQKF